MVKQFKVIFLFAVLLFAKNCFAQGAMTVYNPTSLAELQKQLTEAKKSITNQLEQIAKLKEQITILNDVKELNKEITDTIGVVSSITLPITSLNDVSSQLRKDATCLFPNMPDFGISFDDMDTSLCDRTARYRAAFFNDKKELKDMSWSEQLELRQTVQSNIEKFSSDTVARALAQSDIQQTTVEDQGKVADQLQDSLDSAKTLQERMEVNAQTQIALLRANANQTQLLAQMLKLQATLALQFGVNLDVVPSEELDEED